jgi:hypothetical protein
VSTETLREKYAKKIATMKEALPCLTQLVVGLSPPRSGFDAISRWIYGGQI